MTGCYVLTKLLVFPIIAIVLICHPLT